MSAPQPLFNVLILYDTAQSGACATAVYQRLRGNLEPDYDLHVKCWKFSMVADPGAGVIATREAAAADMVILAWGGGSAGLSPIQHWLNEWPSTSQEARRALVSLYTGPKGQADSPAAADVDRILQAVASRTGMDLISSVPLDRENLTAVVLEERHGLRAAPASFPTPTLSAARQVTSVRHWGINE